MWFFKARFKMILLLKPNMQPKKNRHFNCFVTKIK